MLSARLCSHRHKLFISIYIIRPPPPNYNRKLGGILLFFWRRDAEKPGSLAHGGSIYARLKVRSVYVRGPKGKNAENSGPAACSPKFDNFGP